MIKERKWQLTFRNIPRGLNDAADHMCRLARDMKTPGAISITPASLSTTDHPQIDLETIYRQ